MIADHLSMQEKVKIVRLYSKHLSIRETRHALYQEGVDSGRWGKVGIEWSGVPSTTTIHNINQLFDETGCVEKRKHKSFSRNKSVKTAENLAMVREEMLKSPDVSKSHRILPAALGLSSSSIYTILKELKLKHYIPRLC